VFTTASESLGTASQAPLALQATSYCVTKCSRLGKWADLAHLVAERNKREDHDVDENKLKVCIIPAMTSTSEKTQPPEKETISTTKPNYVALSAGPRATTRSPRPRSYMRRSNAKLWQINFLLVSSPLVRLTAMQFPEELSSADPHIPVGNTGD
jgi:hypothetical protein